MDNYYIWNKIQQSSDDNTYFVQERNYPALIGEVLGQDINENVRVNLRTRFPYLLDSTKKTNEYKDKSITMHDWELDLFLHLVAHLDLLSGFNKNNEKVDRIRTEIEEGFYGEEISNIFKQLNCRDQDIILRNYSNLKIGLLIVFHNAFKELFPEGLIYRKKDEIYVYINKEKNYEDDIKFYLLKKIFIPINMNLKVYYKYHIGIIGIKETMKIGKIRII